MLYDLKLQGQENAEKDEVSVILFFKKDMKHLSLNTAEHVD